MSVPKDVRTEVRELLWRLAEQAGWLDLPDSAKAKYYEQWTDATMIGGRLSQYIDKAKVRVYIKDSLLKPFVRTQLSDPSKVLRAIGIAAPNIIETYIKPHGCRLDDSRVVAWGRATDWRTILLAVHERTFFNTGSTPCGVVFLRSSGKFHETNIRNMVEAAASKLGIQKVVWLQS